MTAYELFSLFDSLTDDASVIASIYEALQGAYIEGYDTCLQAQVQNDFADFIANFELADEDIREPRLNAAPEGFTAGVIYDHSEGHDFSDDLPCTLRGDADLFFSDDVDRSERTLDEVEDDIIVGTTRRYPDGPSR